METRGGLSNTEELTRFASEHTQELVELEMQALMNDVRYV